MKLCMAPAAYNILARRKNERRYEPIDHPISNRPRSHPQEEWTTRGLKRRLHPPFQRVAQCRRELVLRSLNVARSGKLSILYGPAGYGKTTTLAQWRQDLMESGLPVIWLTTAPEDSEPHNFLRALMHALRDAGIDLGDAARWAAGDAPAIRRLESIILALEQSAKPCTLILDGFEAINIPVMNDVLADLIDMLPDHAHLALASRRKPLLPLAANLARGNVRLFGPDELRLNMDEMAEILCIPKDSSDLAIISERTEGWPIAVQLYQLWRDGIDDRFTAVHTPPLADLTQYMTDEIFQNLSADHRNLLIDLSIFPEIETHLADHVRQAEDSAILLEQISDLLPGLIERREANMDLSYRLHPLISDYAGRWLKMQNGRQAQLRHSAATYLWEERRYGEALNQALMSHDTDLQLRFVETFPTLELFLSRGTDELRAILKVVPPGPLRRSAKIRLAEALTLSKAGLFKDAWRIMESLKAEDISDAATEIERLTVQSIIASHFMPARSAADLALDRIAAMTPAPMICAFVDNGWAVAHQQCGDLDAARRALARAESAYDSSGDFPVSHNYLRTHGLQIALAEGRYDHASDLAQAILADHRDSPMAHVWLATARIALAAVEYQRTYRLRAADQIKMALALLGEGDATFDQYAIALPILLDATMRRDGPKAAMAEVTAIARQCAERGLTSMSGMVAALDLLYQTRSGLASPMSDSDLTDLAAQAPHATPWRERDSVKQAVILRTLADGLYEQAFMLAHAMLQEGQTGHRLGTQIKGLVLLGLVQEHMDDAPAAERSVTEALRLATAENILAPFAEEANALQPILERLATGQALSKSARHLEKIMHLSSSFNHSGQLTEREAEILSHLADGASNKLIARRLELTEHTVKFHLKNIFAKLGVASRKEAATLAFRDF